MRANRRDMGGAQARHNSGQGLMNTVETAGKIMPTVHGIYTAGKAILPYVRPMVTALAAAV